MIDCSRLQTLTKTASSIFMSVRRAGRKNLLETEAKKICTDYGIPVTRFSLAKSESEAVSLASEIGFPVVLKIVSPDIIHKSDVGGVIVDLRDTQAVAKAYIQILSRVKEHVPRARIVGVIVQEMAPPSTEVIVGAVKDLQFGPVIMFGLGGVFVEVLKDVTFRVAPIDEEDACEMITEVKAYPLLKGYRNTPKADVDAITSILLNTSKLIMQHEEIKELDLNPVIVYEKGAKTVDARMVLE